MSALRGRGAGPRRAPSPRSGANRRVTGSARRPGHVGAVAFPARELDEQVAAAPVAIEPRAQPVTAEATAKPAPAPVAAAAPGELSGLRLLLDQLDALLRDPTIANALKAFTARLTGGLRALRLPRLRLPRLRLPRRLLLGLLLLTLPFAVAALLTSGDDERAPATADRGAQAPGSTGLGGAGMPVLASAPDEVAPVSVALVLDDTYGEAARRRELRALGDWLAQHHAPGTRVSLIDARTGDASAPLRPADLALAQTTRPRASTTSAVRSAFEGGQGRRLLVTLGSAAPPTGASTLSVQTRRGAGSAVATRGAKRSQATIDDRRPQALAASVARAIMALSGQSERR